TGWAGPRASCASTRPPTTARSPSSSPTANPVASERPTRPIRNTLPSTRAKCLRPRQCESSTAPGTRRSPPSSEANSPACGEGFQPVACLIDRLRGDGEGQPQIALAGRAEGRAGDRGEVVLLQQLGRQLPGVQSPVLDIDEGIEGRLGADEVQALDGVDALDHEFAALGVG